MKAVAGALPDDPRPWAFEVKWDGMRLVVGIDPAADRVRLATANGLDATDRFPDLGVLTEAVDLPAVVDGEVVALVDGRPDFARLQHRMHVAAPDEAARRAREIPVEYVIFDLLWLDGHDLTNRPWHERRHLLDASVTAGERRVLSGVHEDGRALLDAVRQQGLEGVVAKRRDGLYRPGRRSPTWRKIKVRDQREFVVGGWTPGQGARAGGLGALLLGFHEGTALRYAGRVGTGWDEAEGRRLLERLGPLAVDTDPFTPPLTGAEARGVQFVEPRLVVEVAIGGWTAEHRVRHASYLGERLDVDPADVTDRP